jgi:hypothetical protein
MRVESIVTCLEYAEVSDPLESRILLSLLGAFRRLDHPPGRFVVYLEIRLDGLDSTDGIGVKVRCRTPGKRGIAGVWYETEGHLVVVGQGPDVVQLPVEVEQPDMPSGRSIVQVLIDGRVERGHGIDFGT